MSQPQWCLSLRDCQIKNKKREIAQERTKIVKVGSEVTVLKGRERKVSVRAKIWRKHRMARREKGRGTRMSSGKRLRVTRERSKQAKQSKLKQSKAKQRGHIYHLFIYLPLIFEGRKLLNWAILCTVLHRVRVHIDRRLFYSSTLSL
jgi:hypothetical protein